MKIAKIILSSALFMVVMPFQAFALNTWENITPSPDNTFNSVEAVGDYVLVGGSSLYMSSDKGVTWSTLWEFAPINSVAIGWTYAVLTSSYKAESGTPLYFAADTGVYKTQINGDSIIRILPVKAYDIEVDQFEAVVNSKPTVIYAGTDLGISRSDDGGLTWTSPMLSKPVIKISSDVVTGDIYALTSDSNLYKAVMKSVSGEEESWVLVRPAATASIEDISILAGGGSTWLASNTGILKSDSSGSNWQSVSSGLPSASVVSVHSDYKLSNLAYAAIPGFGVYRTTTEANSIPAWLPVNDGLLDLAIKQVRTNPSSSRNIYAISNSEVYKMDLSRSDYDFTPPSKVTDFALGTRSGTSLTFGWTAPGDDSTVGMATMYDLRCNAETITETNWDFSMQLIPAPIPNISGSQETVTVAVPSSDTSYYCALKASDEVGNTSPLSNVVYASAAGTSVIDTIAPSVTSLSIPSSSASLVVSVSVTATDNVGVIGYFLSESATKPVASISGWSQTPPVTFTFTSEGAKTLYAFAKDSAGNVSSAKSATTVINIPDTTAPVVTVLNIPATSNSVTVPVQVAATDAVGVTGFYLSENSVSPSVSALAWSANAPVSFSFSSDGAKTLYAFAKDAAGNISSVKSASTLISVPDTIAPVISSAATPAVSASLTIQVSVIATDNVAVTGYILSENPTKPGISSPGWSEEASLSYTFSSEGAKTLYVFVKDAAGNVSSSKSISINISVPDTEAPTLLSFSIPTTYTSLSLPVTLEAADNRGVTAYYLSESSTQPSSSSSGWTSTKPTSFVFSTAGTKTLYASVKDAAGNVSASKSATTNITLPVPVPIPVPDTEKPIVTSLVLPNDSSTLSVPVSVAATDNVAVTGYFLSESSIAPSPTLSGWTTIAPTSFTFTVYGNRTLYAFAKDAAGNVSISKSATISISLPPLPPTEDTIPPVISSFSVQRVSNNLSVSLSVSASDNQKITGYLVTESSSPSFSTVVWKQTIPTSFTFSSIGPKTLYVFAKDAAGNISQPRSDTVLIREKPGGGKGKNKVFLQDRGNSAGQKTKIGLFNKLYSSR